MKGSIRFLLFFAMMGLMVVSIWTTYASLRDSILPAPSLDIPLPNGEVWNCSVFALILALAIGLMLFALKVAIIDGQKRLNAFGMLGLFIMGFISIAFNMDVLYRTYDRDFFFRYSASKMVSQYEDYLAQVQTKLNEKRDALRKQVAVQEAEVDSEVKGIRKAPAGYGPLAKQEDYKLALLQGSAKVELESLEKAIASEEKANALLADTQPKTLDEIESLQNELRLAIRDAGVAAGIPLPPPVRTENPFFAVFSHLFDYKSIGFKEIFFLMLAILLDLGDIIGYSMLPEGPKKRDEDDEVTLARPVAASRAEYVPAWYLTSDETAINELVDDRMHAKLPAAIRKPDNLQRPFRIRKR